MPTNNTPGALDGLRILDLTSALGQPCGRALADLGADVVLVEPPEGSPSRKMAPFAGDIPHHERSIYFLNFNTNKRSVALDLSSSQGKSMLQQLALHADAIIESHPVGHLDSLGLGYRDLATHRPDLVFTSITPFGQTGPYRDFVANDLVLDAVGGYVFTEGEPGEAPVAQPHYQTYQLTGLHAAFGTLLALRHRDRTGEGQHVDVAAHEVIASCQMHLRDYVAHLDLGKRWGSLPGPRGGLYPGNIYACRDGWVVLTIMSDRQWRILTEWAGDPVLLQPKFRDPSIRTAELALINERIGAFVGRWDRHEFLEQTTQRRLSAGTMHSPAEFFEDPHVVERGTIVETEHPVAGRYKTVGGPVLYSRTPWRIRRPAPLLGQHTDEVQTEWLALKRAAARPHSSGALKPSSGELPLAGVRVAAFSRGWAAPYGTRYLGDYGAEVVKVESAKFSDGRTVDRNKEPDTWWELESMFAEMNRNKLSITLDLHTKEGQDIFKQLAIASDVVVENNKPGAMERFELAYEDLRRIKSDVIMVRGPAYGLTGPLRDHPAIGQCITAFTGLGYLWGFPNSSRQSRSKSAYPDLIVGAHIAFAVMAALRHRDATGEGQQVEVPQFQATASMIGTAYLEHSLSNTGPEPMGNRDWNGAPQGVYRCKGDDRWCAIACTTDDEWRRLCELIEKPELADEPSLSSAGGRAQRHDELDATIEAWTAQRTPHQAMLMCQRSGIPAGVVASSEDLYRDPQLRERNYIVSIDHPTIGRLEHPGMTVRLTKTPGQIHHPCPMIGQHTSYVLREILGIPEEEQRQLEAAGAVA